VLKFGFKLGTTFTETFKILMKHNTFLSERVQQTLCPKKVSVIFICSQGLQLYSISERWMHKYW